MNTLCALYRFTMLRNGVHVTPFFIVRVTVTSSRCVAGRRMAFLGPPTTCAPFVGSSQRPVSMLYTSCRSWPTMYVYGVPLAYPSRADRRVFGDFRYDTSRLALLRRSC